MDARTRTLTLLYFTNMTLKKNLKLLKWFNFFTDFKLYAPIAIIYFTHITHSYALGASIFAIAQISSAFIDVPAGIFADRIGRKRSIIIGAATAVCCNILRNWHKFLGISYRSSS